MHRSALLALALLATGCTPDYPMDRPGTWQASGANDRNLRLMVADPSHLQRGVGAATDRGEAAAAPIDRLNEGRRYALPIEATSSLRSTGGGNSSGGGGGAAR
jgi:hypothetical protein